MRPLPLALLLGALACGGAGAEPEEVPAPTPVGGETPRDEVEVEREVPGLARALGPTATFTDLVAAARRLDDRGEGASDAGCLLRGSGEAGGAWRLEAELAVALRPLPEPGAALSRRAARGRPFRLLSRWGRRGDAEGLTLVAFTDAPPPPAGPLGALLLTEAGVHALRSDRALAGASAPLEGWAFPEALDGVTQLVVSADAGTPLARLRRLLAALPEAASRDVVLAVPLPEDVRLPDAPSPADADDLLCGEEGLPASSGPLGELAPAQLLETLRPFHQEASACFAQASAEAAEGGRLVLHFRVGPDGAVQAACAREDDLGDPALRRCVVSRLSALRFPAPDPPGHVDAALPLVFRPDRSAAPRALCP